MMLPPVRGGKQIFVETSSSQRFCNILPIAGAVKPLTKSAQTSALLRQITRNRDLITNVLQPFSNTQLNTCGSLVYLRDSEMCTFSLSDCFGPHKWPTIGELQDLGAILREWWESCIKIIKPIH
jgi:hypothetical protein